MSHYRVAEKVSLTHEGGPGYLVAPSGAMVAGGGMLYGHLQPGDTVDFLDTYEGPKLGLEFVKFFGPDEIECSFRGRSI